MFTLAETANDITVGLVCQLRLEGLAIELNVVEPWEFRARRSFLHFLTNALHGNYWQFFVSFEHIVVQCFELLNDLPFIIPLLFGLQFNTHLSPIEKPIKFSQLDLSGLKWEIWMPVLSNDIPLIVEAL